MGRFDILLQDDKQNRSRVKAPRPQVAREASSEDAGDEQPVRPVRGVRPVLPVPPPTKRVMKSRHPFDIYTDQYEALQQLALEERMRGGVGSMSAIVREALDKIIAERTQQNRS